MLQPCGTHECKPTRALLIPHWLGGAWGPPYSSPQSLHSRQRRGVATLLLGADDICAFPPGCHEITSVWSWGVGKGPQAPGIKWLVLKSFFAFLSPLAREMRSSLMLFFGLCPLVFLEWWLFQHRVLSSETEDDNSGNSPQCCSLGPEASSLPAFSSFTVFYSMSKVFSSTFQSTCSAIVKMIPNRS